MLGELDFESINCVINNLLYDCNTRVISEICSERLHWVNILTCRADGVAGKNLEFRFKNLHFEFEMPVEVVSQH